MKIQKNELKDEFSFTNRTEFEFILNEEHIKDLLDVTSCKYNTFDDEINIFIGLSPKLRDKLKKILK